MYIYFHVRCVHTLNAQLIDSNELRFDTSSWSSWRGFCLSGSNFFFLMLLQMQWLGTLKNCDLTNCGLSFSKSLWLQMQKVAAEEQDRYEGHAPNPSLLLCISTRAPILYLERWDLKKLTYCMLWTDRKISTNMGVDFKVFFILPALCWSISNHLGFTCQNFSSFVVNGRFSEAMTWGQKQDNVSVDIIAVISRPEESVGPPEGSLQHVRLPLQVTMLPSEWVQQLSSRQDSLILALFNFALAKGECWIDEKFLTKLVVASR